MTHAMAKREPTALSFRGPCQCNGTGFTSVYMKRGKEGKRYHYVDRCPQYVEYFQTHELLSRPDEQEGQCKAAIERHREIWNKKQGKKSSRRPSEL